MESLFKPTYRIKKVWGITPESLKKLGIKTILADLDNTLVAWNKPEGDESFFQWYKKLLDAGIKLIVVSNNSTKRVSKAVNALGLPYESWSFKPLPFGINKTIRDFDLLKDEVVMVGDQIMTDVIASNLAGVKSVLVQPLITSDSFPTKINRFFEKIVIGKDPVEWGNDLIDTKRPTNQQNN
ncbi:YqeG family HAD IIIA-type phosphatase [Oenococcus alcoholitolerans]|uniref:YqeG family HAD IIIA-type phosphatase n=1 Tax=Oenococcus alcoholitolerans TaxID=931074 RepID=UPI003F719A0D